MNDQVTILCSQCGHEFTTTMRVKTEDGERVEFPDETMCADCRNELGEDADLIEVDEPDLFDDELGVA